MKKFIAVSLLSALLLSACDTTDENRSDINNSSDMNTSSVESSSSSSAPDNSSSTSESSSETESSSADESSSPAENPPEEPDENSFKAPNGEVLNITDGELVEDGMYKFEHSYIRYTKPIFYNTVDDPDIINWDTMHFSVDFDWSQEADGFFKVKAGDKLENGLTVKSADIYLYHGGFSQSHIEFEGELTLEGIVYRVPEDVYGSYQDEIIFFVDPAKSTNFPAPIGAFDVVGNWWIDEKSKLAFLGDYAEIRLGNYKEMADDFSGVVERGEFARLKIKIKDLKYKYWDGPGGTLTAELVSFE